MRILTNHPPSRRGVTRDRFTRARDWSRRLLAAGFIGAGTLHFVVPSVYEAVMPSYLPLHRELVLVSGLLEILGGLGLAAPSPRVRRAASWGLAVLLVLIFPANVHMAVNEIQVGDVRTGSLGWWLRLPLQPLLIWWVLWSARLRR
ncbi:MAG: DoxX family protein [Chloroflexota bacterium]|nr:DoxX family protein [Chloroflexota bacterium]